MGTLEIQLDTPRASDADRDRVIGVLRSNAAEGRISHETFLVRLDAALAARYQGDLSGLTADLVDPDAEKPGPEAADQIESPANVPAQHPDIVFSPPAGWPGGQNGPHTEALSLPSDGQFTRWLIDTVGRLAMLKSRLRAAWRIPQLPQLLLPEPSPYPLRIGRGDNCDLALADDSVSRRHAELIFLNGGWLLRDLRSTNGTTVNGWRITAEVAVKPGDVVGFGDLTFRLGAR